MAAPTQSLLGLPPVPPELKSIIPFLQRADELKKQVPVVAYWCAYYAAQVGILLKARDTSSRNVLFHLLAVLEQMKKEIGPNDAIDVEAASAAYVENFALKVFAAADHEDRQGSATKSTAKKFLAASNFLEVLKVFSKTEISESAETKSKYAKWKAADIAKAFREGRKPTPGPAGSEPLPPATSPQQSAHSPNSTATLQSPALPPSNSHSTTSSTNTASSSQSRISTTTSKISPSISPPFQNAKLPTPPHLKRVSPPPHIDPSDIARANGHLSHAPSRFGAVLGITSGGVGEDDVTPDNWSTTATPGDFTTNMGSDGGGVFIEQRDKGKAWDRRSGSESSSGGNKGGSLNGTTDRKAWVSEELEPGVRADDKKAVHFISSITGDSPGWDVTGVASFASHEFTAGGDAVGVIPPPPPPFEVSSQPVSPTTYRHSHSAVDTDSPTSSSFGSPPSEYMTSPSRSNVSHSASGLAPPPPISPPIPPPLPIPSHQDTFLHSLPLEHPSLQPDHPTVELTPTVVAKAQKHCRFAISALDYEDAEQAKKELRAALSTLGGL